MTLVSHVGVLRAVLYVCLLCSFLSACDEFRFFDKIGVSQLDEGPVVHLHLCPDEKLTRLTLEEEGELGTTHDDEVLWRIVAPEGVSVDEIVLGRLPPGFSEVALKESLPTHVRLQVRVSTTELDDYISIGFEVDELRPGSITNTEGDPLSPDEFIKAAQAACD